MHIINYRLLITIVSSLIFYTYTIDNINNTINDKTKTMLKIGHRGACAYYPENTLSSFEHAIHLGVDAVELDVHICASGELVVIHDITVNRTTNGKGKVAHKTLAQLKQLDIPDNQKIPTLQEVFDAINRRVIINIELKGYDTARATAELIKHYIKTYNWKPTDFMVSSFDHPELALFHTLCPSVPFGPILEGIPIRYAQFAQDMGAHFVVAAKDFLTKAYIDDAHARNLPIFAYTLNRKSEIRHFKALCVDGMFSDCPDRL